MTTENLWAHASITPAAIEAVVRKARAERAEATRQMLAGLPAALMQLVAHIRPSRQRVPHKPAIEADFSPISSLNYR